MRATVELVGTNHTLRGAENRSIRWNAKPVGEGVVVVASMRERVERHIELFNNAVRAGDFGPMLAKYADHAVLRFENVPGAGVLEFNGRDEIDQAYRTRPPDDEMDLAGEPSEDGDTVTVPFAWRADGATGTMYLTYGDELLTRVLVRFD